MVSTVNTNYDYKHYNANPRNVGLGKKTLKKNTGSWSQAVNMSSEQKKYDCKKMEVKRMKCKEDR
jgi:hypothetical protein